MVSVKVCRVNPEKAQTHHLSASKFAAVRVVYLIEFRRIVKFIKGKYYIEDGSRVNYRLNRYYDIASYIIINHSMIFELLSINRYKIIGTLQITNIEHCNI